MWWVMKWFFHLLYIKCIVLIRLLYKYEKELSEDCVFSTGNFSVASNMGSYRTARHPYKINFQYGTKIKRCDDNLFLLASMWSMILAKSFNLNMIQITWSVSWPKIELSIKSNLVFYWKESFFFNLSWYSFIERNHSLDPALPIQLIVNNKENIIMICVWLVYGAMQRQNQMILLLMII